MNTLALRRATVVPTLRYVMPEADVVYARAKAKGTYNPWSESGTEG